jgi:hypothetical protein
LSHQLTGSFHRIKESAFNANGSGLSPEAKVEFEQVWWKLIEHQLALAILSVPMFLWFALIAAKVLLARYFVVIICAFLIELMIVCFVLSNYFYLWRKRRRAAPTVDGHGHKPRATSSRSNEAGKVHSSPVPDGVGAGSSVLLNPSSTSYSQMQLGSATMNE